MRTIRTKVYQFSELSESAKQKALEICAYYNVSDDWYQSVYDDAKNIGLEIKGFDIDRASYCKGEFDRDGKDVACAILDEHGKDCETYKTAQSFMNDYNAIFDKYPVIDDEIGQDENEYDRDYELDDLEAEFKESLCEDYRIMLSKEYDYLTSEKVIIENIEANEYEFKADGTRF